MVEMRKLTEFFEGFRRGVKEFGATINITVSTILLSLVYLIGVGITAFFAKLFRKHFLDIEISKEKETYWVDLNIKKKSKEEYYRQF